MHKKRNKVSRGNRDFVHSFVAKMIKKVLGSDHIKIVSQNKALCEVILKYFLITYKKSTHTLIIHIVC